MTAKSEGPMTIEVLFMGTGTSSGLPLVACLTRPPNEPQCACCTATRAPNGGKNVRGNTGIVTRCRNGQDEVTIVVDVGKTWNQKALELFPKHGLRRIDAVLITHAHADGLAAVNGLDDLRSWTLEGAIQPSIDIYLTRQTLTDISRAFPYLVSKEHASGGGDVPAFVYHIIHPGQVFTISRGSCNVGVLPITGTGITLTPVHVERPSVHHGQFFGEQAGEPYLSMGLSIDRLLYIPDASGIPEDSYKIISELKLEVLIIDCLRPREHKSHFGLAQSIEATRRINAPKTYFIGFAHDITHNDWDKIGDVLETGNWEEGGLSKAIMDAMEHVPREPRMWVRPSYDGLLLRVEG